MKKTIAIMLIIATMITVFAGCGANNPKQWAKDHLSESEIGEYITPTNEDDWTVDKTNAGNYIVHLYYEIDYERLAADKPEYAFMCALGQAFMPIMSENVVFDNHGNYLRTIEDYEVETEIARTADCKTCA